MIDNLLRGWETLQRQHDGLGENSHKTPIVRVERTEERELGGGGREIPAPMKLYHKTIKKRN